MARFGLGQSEIAEKIVLMVIHWLSLFMLIILIGYHGLEICQRITFESQSCVVDCDSRAFGSQLRVDECSSKVTECELVLLKFPIYLLYLRFLGDFMRGRG